jgi:hypothetical protein
VCVCVCVFFLFFTSGLVVCIFYFGCTTLASLVEVALLCFFFFSRSLLNNIWFGGAGPRTELGVTLALCVCVCAS